MEAGELKTECRTKAKELINAFYQPLGFLSCGVNSDTMWEHAKQRALEVCKIMLEVHSCYTLNDDRWAYWAQIEIELNAHNGWRYGVGLPCRLFEPTTAFNGKLHYTACCVSGAVKLVKC